MSTETERKEDKAMTNTEDARRAHELLDELDARAELSQEQEKLLRSFLPELPKQKTLQEIIEHVNEAWAGTRSNTWWGDGSGVGVYLEDWLSELHTQLQGLKDTPATVPALPAGMRLADHAEYGRVVTSPKPDQDGVYVLLISTPKVETGADWEYAHECELTFIDAEPAKPAHPEFLETEADYQNAPEGTIVACDDSPPCHKFGSEWSSVLFYGMKDNRGMSRAIRRVLRWGWGK